LVRINHLSRKHPANRWTLVNAMNTQSNHCGNRAGSSSPLARFGAIALVLLGGVGCAPFEKAALRRSELYYKATSLERLSPKPETERIPFLDKVPKGGRILGVFQFSTERGRDFAMRSIEHNARRVGADAVWVRGLGEGHFPQTRAVPAHWETQPFTRFEYRQHSVPGGPGKPDRIIIDAVPVTGYRQAFVPEQRWTNIVRYSTVDALMLKLR
jgi:hypothetical protein